MNALDSAPIEQIQWNRKGNVMQCVQERERETERERMFVCVCACACGVLGMSQKGQIGSNSRDFRFGCKEPKQHGVFYCLD